MRTLTAPAPPAFLRPSPWPAPWCDARHAPPVPPSPMRRESEQAAASGVRTSGRTRPYLARARDPIFCAHDPFAACATRAQDSSRARPFGPLIPRVSHLSHLIPLNPGESRFENVAGFPRASCTLACAHVRSGRASARRLRDVNRCRAFVARVPARRYSRPADAALAGRAAARTTERSVPVGERSRRRGGAGALAPVGNPPHALKNEEEARSPRGSRRTTCGIE